MKKIIITSAILIILIILIIIINKKNNYLNYKNDFSSIIVDNYSDLLKNSINKDIKYTPGGIPKIIFKTSWQKELPSNILKILKDTTDLNPDYKLYYFDDTDCETFLENFSIRILNAYKKIIPGAYKADLFRYCVLYEYGGCYSDIGHIMLESFDTICGEYNTVLIKDANVCNNITCGIHNALICVTKEDILMKKCIDQCLLNIESNYYGNNSLDITGPRLIGKELIKILDIKSMEEFNKNPNYTYFFINNNKSNSLKLYKFSDDLDYIVDPDNNEVILKRKFKNYTDTIYSDQGKLHYSTLWNKKNIYVKNKK